MRTYLTGLFVLLCTACIAQRDCGTSAYIESQRANPAVRQRIDAAFQLLESKGSEADETPSSSIIRVPVVVHVLYNKAADNIADERIHQQLQILNNDFRRRNADTSKTPTRFKDVAADIEVEFYLATVDPQGRATNGIVRKATHMKSFQGDDKMKYSSSGGNDAWDTRYYLNVWVVPSLTLVGYSSVPGLKADLDGVVVGTNYFGISNFNHSFNSGRTLVHEVGHWLGLKHIWGDSYCGDDGVGDTPKQGNFTVGCPTTIRSSCSNGPAGDMYMNYMDYTNEACMNMFTAGQKQRMRATFQVGGVRHQLLYSKALGNPWNDAPVEVVPATPRVDVLISPNPTSGSATLSTEAAWSGAKYTVMNSSGVALKAGRVAKTSQPLDLHSLTAGIYLIVIEGNAGRKTIRFIKN